MTIAPDIATDLVTPLGAYLRLRREGRAAFLLESVERGRLEVVASRCALGEAAASVRCREAWGGAGEDA